MTNEINLKELWNRVEIKAPDIKEIIDKTKRFKRKTLFVLIIKNIVLLLTCLFIGFVWYNYKPEMITTKIGIVLEIIAIALYLFVYNNMIPLLINNDYDMNIDQYLQQLLRLKKKQLFLHTTILNIYCIILSAGFLFYLLEFALRMNLISAVVLYSLVFSFIAFFWVVFRSKKIKKEQAKFNELIIMYEKIRV